MPPAIIKFVKSAILYRFIVKLTGYLVVIVSAGYLVILLTPYEPIINSIVTIFRMIEKYRLGKGSVKVMKYMIVVAVIKQPPKKTVATIGLTSIFNSSQL